MGHFPQVSRDLHSANSALHQRRHKALIKAVFRDFHHLDNAFTQLVSL